MTFSSLFGLDPAVAMLRRALTRDRLPGTYLFVGPQGVGKTALALAFAQAASCLDPVLDPYDACGACGSCRRMAAGTHTEVTRIAPAGDVTQIWQFWDRDNRPSGALERSLWHAPVVGRRRVYVVERADTLNEAAANSILKVLEEPPSAVVFVLLAPHASRVLSTVLSRSQVVRLWPAPIAALAEWLQIEHEAPGPAARRAAAWAEGRPGDALRLVQDATAQEELDSIMAYAEALAGTDALGAPRAAEALRALAGHVRGLAGDAAAGAPGADDGEAPAARERVSRRALGCVVGMLQVVYRDALALRLDIEGARLVNADARVRLADLASRRSAEGWMDALEALAVARRRIDQNVSIALLTDALAVRLVAARTEPRLQLVQSQR